MILLNWHKYQQKPEQWGDEDAVRSAVMRNAESVFGVPVESVKLALPFWENAGDQLHDYSCSGIVGDISAVTWTPEGLLFDTSYGYVDLNISPATLFDSSGTTTLSIVMLFQHNGVATGPYPYFWYTPGGEYQDFSNVLDISNVYDRFYLNFGYTRTYLDELLDGEEHTFATTAVEGSIGKIYHDGSAKTTSGNTTISLEAITNNLQLGRSNSASRQTNCTLKSFLGFDTILTPSQVALFNDAPYALFARNPAPVYFDFGTAGLSLSRNIAWRLQTAKEAPTAWAIATAVDQALAWRIMTAAAAATAWRLITKATRETGWAILTTKETPVAWRLVTQLGQSVAWKILSAAGLSCDIAWRIITGMEQESAWAILTDVSRGVAWRLATSKDQALAWRLLTEVDRDSAWRLKNQLQGATAWRIFTVDDRDVSWRLLDAVQRDTAWRVVTAAEADTAWAILTDQLPEALKVFAARRRNFIHDARIRTFIYNAKARTFIFLAKER